MKKKQNIIQPNEDNFDELFEQTDFGTVENSNKNNGTLIKAVQCIGRPKVGRRFNVTMPEELIKKLEKAGKKRGVGYQTMVRLICSEKIADYLKQVH